MKTVEHIKNEYAKEQGYDSWWLLNVYCKDISEHYEKIILIVQDELKKKVSDDAVDKFLERHINWGDLEKSILNTENIK